MHYEYCPHCGQKLVDRQAGDDGLILYCNSCKKYWFDTFASCVIILIYNEQDEVMLCRQEYLSKEYEVITSGFIIPGETAEAAALREVKEELGLDLEELEYAGTHWFGRGDMLMHCFMGFTHKKEPVLSPEINAAHWVPILQLPETAFPDSPENAIFPIYRKLLKKLGYPVNV